MKSVLITAAITLCLLMSCQRKALSQTPIKSKVDSCLNILRAYSNYWKKDSISETGFRELLGYRVLVNCDCKNRLWKDIGELLGKPNYTYTEKNNTKYRYKLNNYSNDIKHPGTLLLDIIVNVEGVVILFSVWEVDG